MKINTKKARPVPGGTPDAEVEKKRRRAKKKMAVRWGDHMPIIADGFVPVARNFLRYAAHLKPFPLTPGEQLFVINLMYHKWDAERPYPTYATLSSRMGKSVQYARDIARSLQAKGYLEREVRRGRSNRFELQPLFDALAQHVEAEGASKPPRQEDEPEIDD